jgi:hypothetical protein
VDATDTLRNAVIGAVVTGLLAFTVVSPAIGGAVAGYLQREPPARGPRVGAISGAIASIPFLLALTLGVVVFVGTTTTGGIGVPSGVELAIVLLFVVPLGVLWNAGLRAVDGYVGAYVRANSGSERATPTERGRETG